MTLFEAYERGLPLVIEIDADNARLAAALADLGDGRVFFADIGWPESSSHPFHVLQGRAAETAEGWRIGRIPVRVAAAGEQLHQDWARWQAWRRSDEGRRFAPELALETARAEGLV